MLPDLPNRPNPRAFWFTAEHAEMAMERLRRTGKAQPKPMTWKGVERTVKSWPVYIITTLYMWVNRSVLRDFRGLVSFIDHVRGL